MRAHAHTLGPMPRSPWRIGWGGQRGVRLVGAAARGVGAKREAASCRGNGEGREGLQSEDCWRGQACLWLHTAGGLCTLLRVNGLGGVHHHTAVRTAC